MGKIGKRIIKPAKKVETHIEQLEENEEELSDKEQVLMMKSKSKVKSKQIQMRCTVEEFEKLKEYSEKEDMVISDIIRLCLMQKGIL